MVQSLSLILLLLLSVSCGKSASQKEEARDPLKDAPALISGDPVPEEASSFSANIIYVNFTPAQKEKYQKAVEIVRQVVASEEFMAEVLSHTVDGEETYVDNNRRSNGEIYWNILLGNEILQPAANNRMDVEVELYYDDTNTVGYTYPNTKRIWINTKYFDAYEPASVAGNLFHEWLHKLGYNHATTYSPQRSQSVPYAIGYMVRDLGQQYQ